MIHVAKQLLKILYQKPWPLTSVAAARIDPSFIVEEEQSPFYSASSFYPARLGEVLGDRYQLATKLGHGSRSTVWLARDLYQWKWLDQKFVAVKIKSNHQTSPSKSFDNEVSIHNHISNITSKGDGYDFVGHLLNFFVIGGQKGQHQCLVFEPLREPLWLYKKRFPGHAIPSWLLKIQLQMLLHALDYLHSDCRVIHTDLKPDNIMVKLEDLSLLTKSTRGEFDEPLPQKHCEDGRIIYLSRNEYGPPKKQTGLVVITDLDMAVRGDSLQEGCIGAQIYRAPESILESGFTFSADIWNLGVMLWDIVEGQTLFNKVDPHCVNEYDEKKHLALITKLLGPPPTELLTKGKRTHMFYNSDGQPKDLIPVDPDFSFESTINHLIGEDKDMFLKFVKRMIKWRPEDRNTAKELLKDPWLYADFDE